MNSAKLSQNVISKIKLTTEEQWRYSTEFWIEIFLRLCKTMAEDMGLGWDKVNEALLKSADEGWPGVLRALEVANLQFNDARIWASTEAFAGVNAWPGYIDEVTEYTPTRTAIKGLGPSEGGRCIVLDVAIKLGLEKKIDLAAWCAKNADAYLRKINPRLRFVQEKAMCRGDPYDYGYCEMVDFIVKGSEHAYEKLRSFENFKKGDLKPYGE
ncbi:MAG: hypothetical protein QXK88_08885 [Desulfurococcaceae archaeon]